VTEATRGRPHYLKRLWAELGTIGGEHDAFIKVIILERIVKAMVLIALAVGLLVAGRKGWLAEWSEYAQDQLNLAAGHGIIVQLLLRVLVFIGHFSHVSVVAIGAMHMRCSKGPKGSASRCAAAGPSTSP
jgi:hypothetical protein